MKRKQRQKRSNRQAQIAEQTQAGRIYICM